MMRVLDQGYPKADETGEAAALQGEIGRTRAISAPKSTETMEGLRHPRQSGGGITQY